MSTALIEIVRNFVAENFLFRDDQANLSDTDSMLAAGLIDSTGVLEIVAFLEQQFGISVDDADIVPENLDSIHNIASFVGRKRVAVGELATVK